MLVPLLTIAVTALSPAKGDCIATHWSEYYSTLLQSLTIWLFTRTILRKSGWCARLVN